VIFHHHPLITKLATDLKMADAPIEAPKDTPSETADEAAPEATVATEEPTEQVEEGVKLYVGNLSYSTDESRLRDEFGRFGGITDVFLPLDKFSSRPRGFGFVSFETREAAEEAISKMDGTELDGRVIKVNEPRPRGEGGGGGRGSGRGYGGSNSNKEEIKIYVGNLSFDTVADAVKELFEQYGTVTDCFLPTDRGTSRPRGFGFVTMPAKDAEKAINEVNGTELDGRTLRVNEARDRGDYGGGYRRSRGSGRY